MKIEWSIVSDRYSKELLPCGRDNRHIQGKPLGVSFSTKDRDARDPWLWFGNWIQGCTLWFLLLFTGSHPWSLGSHFDEMWSHWPESWAVETVYISVVHDNISTDIPVQLLPICLVLYRLFKTHLSTSKIAFPCHGLLFSVLLTNHISKANPCESYQHNRTQFIPEAKEKIRYLDYSLSGTD